MGREAKAKAQRKKIRLWKKTAPQYVATGHLTAEQRRQFQQDRDRALVEAKRRYEASLLEIRNQYWKRVEAANAQAS